MDIPSRRDLIEVVARLPYRLGLLSRLLAPIVLLSHCGPGQTVAPEPAQTEPSAQEDAGPEDESAWLTDNHAWHYVADASEDPFAEERMRPRVSACGDGALIPTDESYEVELANCRERYATVTQPTLLPLNVGDTASFQLVHLQLIALDEGETVQAYVGLALEQEIIWEQQIVLPTSDGNYSVSFSVDAAVPAGTPLYLHLDNHGQNSYLFSRFEVEQP